MKTLSLLAIALTITAQAAAPTLRGLVERQVQEVHARQPFAYLYEVRASYYVKAPEKTLDSVSSYFALPGDLLRYLTMTTVKEEGKEVFYPGEGYYRPPQHGGAPPPPWFHPKPQPEPEALHRAITDWTIDLEKIGAGVKESGLDLGDVATLYVTTVARMRDSLIGKAAAEALKPHADAKSIVMIVQHVPYAHYANFVILDAATGAILAKGRYFVPKPPPPPPGSVSSGGNR